LDQRFSATRREAYHPRRPSRHIGQVKVGAFTLVKLPGDDKVTKLVSPRPALGTEVVRYEVIASASVTVCIMIMPEVVWLVVHAFEDSTEPRLGRAWVW